MNFVSLADMTAGETVGVADEILLHGASELMLTPPVVVGSDDDTHELQIFWAFETARLCRFGPVRLLCLKDVYVAPEGLAFLASGECIIETIYPWEKANVDSRFPRLSSSADWLPTELVESQIVAEAIHLREPGEAGYFHWINSVLPRLVALQRFHRLSGLPLAIDIGKAFAKDSTRLLGINPEQTLPLGQGYLCNRLWVFSPAVIRGDHFTRAKFWTDEVRRRFSPGTSTISSRRIYLSRRDANIRNVADEPALIQLLARYGFESVVIGKMSFADQVSLFSSCELLVSAHGAGLSNAIFMQRGRIIEILPRTRPWPTFRTLAGRAGLSYAAFISRAGRDETGEVAEGNEGIDIDLKKFEHFLRQAIE